MSESQQTANYIHGHHASVLRSHIRRTVENSASYVLSSIRPDMKILDIGCGPGTITVDFAERVPQGHVTGLEQAADVLNQARAIAKEKGLANIDFVTGDALSLPLPDASFDLVHAHQVIQYVGDPVQVLKEMHRVAKPGGFVAVREIDSDTMTCWPEIPELSTWKPSYLRMARLHGGEPNAGRRLRAWAHKAGYDLSRVTFTASTWCYASPEEVAWWSDLSAERVLSPSTVKSAVSKGLATMEDLQRTAKAWRDWGKAEDAWFGAMHGELVYHV